MKIIEDVPVWGNTDQNTIDQIKNCKKEAAHVALMADNHLGYAVPIGGVVAYEDKVSPSGVGFDIACLSEGSNIDTYFGYHIPIERVKSIFPIQSERNFMTTMVNNHSGSFKTDTKNGSKMLFIDFYDGRSLTCTKDHLVKTNNGWIEAGKLSEDSLVACSPYKTEELIDYDYSKLNIDASYIPNINYFSIFLRTLGFLMSDGHLSKRGNRISWYMYNINDVDDLIRDLNFLKVQYHVYSRNKKGSSKTEYSVCVNNKNFKDMFHSLGVPIGKKTDSWDVSKLQWIKELPKWLISNFLGGFCSGDCTTPSIDKKGIPKQHCIMQSNKDFIIFMKELLNIVGINSFAYTDKRKCSLVISQDSKVEFLNLINFYYAKERRMGSAKVYSHYMNSIKKLHNRIKAYNESIKVNKNIKLSLREISQKYNISYSFCFHAKYGRGMPRVVEKTVPVFDGEFSFCPIKSISELQPDLKVNVYDIPTYEDQHNYLSSGIVVHNCGNCAVRLDVDSKEVLKNISTIMDKIFSSISFGVGRVNDEKVDHDLFDDPAWTNEHIKPLKQLAKNQLGTVGSGNHYVDIFIDELDRVWCGVHFGSRGLGHKIASKFLDLAGGKDGMMVDPVTLDVNSDLGEQYLLGMNLAGRYAYAGRDWVCNKVAQIIRANIVETIHNHHNFAWKERHGERDLWVVRKGATPAFPGQKGFVGGSMCDISVILEGVDHPEAALSLNSTVHGAGRMIGRRAAIGKFVTDENGKKQRQAGLVRHDDWMKSVKDSGIQLRGAGIDESPQCYKRIEEVLAEHSNSINILHTLKPIGVAMAGNEVYDPYKD